MKILVTGGCGFVGSNLALLFKEHYSSYKIIVLDNLKQPEKIKNAIKTEFQNIVKLLNYILIKLSKI